MMKFAHRSLIAALTLFASTAPVSAQEEEKPWTFESVVGASVFFGASEQSAIGLGAVYDYTASHLELVIGGSFDYAEAADAGEDGYVSQRGWTASTNLDYQPEARFSPFALVSGEGSLARGIDRRLSGGLGAKYRMVDAEVTKLDFSLAALLERTEPRDVVGQPDIVQTQGRWSARVRGSRSWQDERYTAEVITFYKPSIENSADDYTLDLEATFDIALNGAVSLQFRLVNKFDSLAESRGARANNDGRFFVSLATKL